MNIIEDLKNNKIMFDGAMGTYYCELKDNDELIAEYANITNREEIKEIHKEYLRAGARILRTNTFAANTTVLDISKKEQELIIKEAFSIAKEAIEEFKNEERDNNKEKDNTIEIEYYIAADIGPLAEKGDTDSKEILDEYERICDCFLEQGAKIFLFETFSDVKYVKIIANMLKEKKNDVFIMATFCLNKNGYTALGTGATNIMQEISIDSIDACGFNCGIGPGHMYNILRKLELPENKFIAILPNAGYPEQLKNRMVFLDNKEYFAENMERIAKLNVDMIGGCCGTTPEYVKKVKETVELIQDKNDRIRSCEAYESKGVKVKESDFYKKLLSNKKVVAVELDPPYDANDEKILECACYLKLRGVDILTFADSPMGRSRADSILTGVKVMKISDMKVMPHIACRDKNMIAMRSGILGAYMNGIRDLLLVTGDPVPSVNRASTTGVFDYNSIQLMNYVKEMNAEHFENEPICYGGALNYARGKIDKVVERMNKKIEAGAKYFLTQPIYSDEDIERIKEIKEKVDTKILCGIMPLISYRNANFIKNEITGINVPDEIVKRYDINMSKEDAQKVGAEVASEIIRKLSPFADGYYFMLPFNRVSIMDQIIID